MVFRKFTYCISFFITCILLLHSFSGFAGNSVPIYEVFSYKEIEKEKEKGKKQKQEKLSEHTYKLGGNNSTSEVPISDFSKLTGMWHGEGFGGYCDEN